MAVIRFLLPRARRYARPEWCGPCKMIAPVLDEIAEERAEDLIVLKLEADANPRSVMEYGVMGIPTLLLFKDGEVVERITGYLPKPKFLARLQPHLNQQVTREVGGYSWS